MECGKCPKPLAEKDAIKCSGCQLYMHYTCAEMQELDFRKILPMNKIKWKCPACKVKKNQTSTTITSNIGSPKQPLDASTSILNVDTGALTTYLDTKFLALRQQWRDDINEAIREATMTLKGDLEKLDSRLSKCEENVQRLDQKLESMEVQDDSGLKQENERLRKDLDVLQTKFDDLDQSARICNVEIQNIPEKKGENLVQLASEIGRLIGIELPDDKIKAIHRTAHNVPSDRPKNIVIQLSSRRLRDGVIAAARARRELSTADLFPKTTTADVAGISKKMQADKKPITKTTTKDKLQEEKLKLQDEKLKKNTYNVSTPRNFVQKSSTADIYKTPKKLPGSSRDYKTTPMKDHLKSSPSSISQISSSTKVNSTSKPNQTSKVSTSKPRIARNSNSTSKSKVSEGSTRTAKDLPFVNVTVNSPIAKRKLDLNITKAIDKAKPKDENRKIKDDKVKSNKTNERDDVERIKMKTKEVERIRSKTRTLDDDEVKELTSDRIDNNEEMMNLKQKLVAKPKAFYVGLDEDNDNIDKPRAQNKSDEEVSYEDDFESYESDFDSYHSEVKSDNSDSTEHDSEPVPGNKDMEVEYGEGSEIREKEKDEENMMDSGSFDLREQRSAKGKPAAMEFILETEEDKASSLDEGFQEGSSAVSSMRTVEVLDRPLFIDFNKSKAKKRKKRIVENMMRRAKDILSMVTLHEMSFTLFEMKPISYDLYMATFGRTNHTQSSVQTFEDGITEEVQTDEIDTENKWTQHPVKFSNFNVYLNDNILKKKRRNSEDYTSKFRFLCEENHGTTDFAYKEYENPLRILLEQKNGFGSCEMLPYDIYKNKLKSDFNANLLGRFLKKVESKVSYVLNLNGTISGNITKSSLPFSAGYVGITTKNVPDETSFLKNAKITNLIFSETKSNLIMTVHKKLTNGVLAGKCLVCLWDASVARSEPIKILVAIDNVFKGRFRGSTDGLLVAALEDGSIHLWDLSEEPTWRNDVASSKKDEIVEIKTELLTAAEIDREFNQKNLNVDNDQRPQIQHALQACAYTSSAGNLTAGEVVDPTVGLEFLRAQAQDKGRRVVGQLCSLQRLGTLTIWTIVQEKSHDIGKAFCSKMKLEKSQTISLTQLLTAKDISDNIFNLNAGKKRLLKRKQEKALARNFTRQKSDDRPASVASARRLPVENKLPHEWETGIVCCDLKIMQYNNSDRFLVGMNGGEVLSCTRSLGAVKVERLCIATDTSSITCLEVSPHGPYFLAGTESGAVSLYSMVEARVLLTLDCRNSLQQDAGPQADFKGRFVEKPRQMHSAGDIGITSRLSITSVLWSRVNPFCIYSLSSEGLSCWELTHSDIYPKHTGVKATIACMSSDGTLALVINEGDVQVHRLSETKDKTIDYSQLFHKYIALL